MDDVKELRGAWNIFLWIVYLERSVSGEKVRAGDADGNNYLGRFKWLEMHVTGLVLL
jgi:hypothetical protein